MVTLEKVEECLNHVNFIIAKSIQDPECKRKGITKSPKLARKTERFLDQCKGCFWLKNDLPCLHSSKMAVCNDTTAKVDGIMFSMLHEGLFTAMGCVLKSKGFPSTYGLRNHAQKFRTIKNMKTPKGFGLTNEDWSELREAANLSLKPGWGTKRDEEPFTWKILESFDDCELLLGWFVNQCESSATTKNFYFLDLVQKSLQKAMLIIWMEAKVLPKGVEG